jgi:hypothetical protein
MSNKETVENEIVNYKFFIDSFMNDLITEVYFKLVDYEIENKANLTFNLYELKINTLIQNNGLNSYIYTSHNNYKNLVCRTNNINDIYNVNVNTVYSLIQPKNELVKLPPPFYFLKINKTNIAKYINTENDIDRAYSNIKRTFDFNDNHKLKIVKFTTETDIYIILFLDSLTYNDTFIFENYDIFEINDETVFNPVININTENTENKKIDIRFGGYNNKYTNYNTGFRNLTDKYLTNMNKSLKLNEKDIQTLKDIMEQLRTDIIKEMREIEKLKEITDDINKMKVNIDCNEQNIDKIKKWWVYRYLFGP